MSLTELEFHEYANLFPLMDDEQLAGLTGSIFNNGFHIDRPIMLFEGKILDGRNRYLACKIARVMPLFKQFTGNDEQALLFVTRENLNRNHYSTSQRALIGARLKSLFEEQAKKRQQAGRVNGGSVKPLSNHKDNIPALVPEPSVKGDSRDLAGDSVNVGAKVIDRADKVIKQGVPELVRAVEQGTISVSAAAHLAELPKAKQVQIVETGDKKAISEAAKEMKTAKQQALVESVLTSYITLDDWIKLTGEEQQHAVMGLQSSKTFNRQEKDNEESIGNIEWAKWSWNPVSGCKHDCPYCYARDIAGRFYEQGFVPTLYPDRLNAPRNTRVPNAAGTDISLKNVFTCSMADLFGRWVPTEWIEAVLQQVRDNPQWNFLFLTKFPKRLAEFKFPDNAWLGTTVDCQIRVKAAEDAFRKLRDEGSGGVWWLSVEPLIEPLQFSSLEMFDWVVIGGSSRSSRTPEWHPPRAWVNALEEQARAAGCKVYEKTNLLERIREYPGFDEPVITEAPAAFNYLGRQSQGPAS